MLQMGVQATFAWLGPLRVLSGVLIPCTWGPQLNVAKKIIKIAGNNDGIGN